jgi:hypothetical protein
MATKAKLEAELAELKKLYSESQDANTNIRNSEATKGAESTRKKSAAKSPKALVDDLSDTLTDLKSDDLENVAKKIFKELEGLPEKKPLLTALGAFVLGFLIGRSR